MVQRDRTRAASRPADPHHGRAHSWALTVVAGALAALWVAGLARQAGRAVFATDECFHAYAAEWIGVHHRLPVTLPEFYSGFAYYYPPAFHVLGAAWGACFGAGALRFLPPTLAAAIAGTLLLAAPRSVSRAAGAWAALLCMANPLVAQYGVKLYVEGLSTLTLEVDVLLALWLLERPAWPRALALGAGAGFALLTKVTGLWVFAALVALALFHAARGARRAAGMLAVSIAVGFAVAAPWLVRNQLLFGSALYPIGGHDVDGALLALHLARFSTPPAAFLRGVPAAIGFPVLAVSAAGLALRLRERRLGAVEILMVLAAAGAGGAAFVPVAASRHLEPFVPVLALTGATALRDGLRRTPAARTAATAALVVIAAYAVLVMPSLRKGSDLPPDLRETFQAVGEHLPAHAVVLSLWTYDTFYYSRRAATWPIPWGQRTPVATLFAETDPRRFLAALDRCGIDAILLPRAYSNVAFDSANYPVTLVDCVRRLIDRGDLRVVWVSTGYLLASRTQLLPGN